MSTKTSKLFPNVRQKLSGNNKTSYYRTGEKNYHVTFLARKTFLGQIYFCCSIIHEIV